MGRRSGFWHGAERIAGNLGRVLGSAIRGVSVPTGSLSTIFAGDDDDRLDEGEELLTAQGAAALVPTVYGCVDLLKTNVAKYPLRFYMGEPAGKRTEIESRPGNIVQLFRAPNDTDTGFTFIEKVVASLDLAGNAYILLDQRGMEIRRMFVLPAHLVQVKNGPNFTALMYTLHYGGKIVPFLPEQIVHLRYWSPKPGPLGMAPMSAANLSFRTQRLAQRWMHSIYLRGGEAGGVFESERAVATAKRDRLELRMKQRHRGPENAGKALYLPPGVKRVSTMLTPAQMELIDHYKMTKADLYEVFSIPPWMKGLKEGSSLGSSGAEVDERLFTDNAVDPRCIRIADGFTHLLLRFIEPTLHCEFDLSGAHSRIRTMLDAAEAVRNAIGAPCLSQNEGRRIIASVSKTDLPPWTDAKYDLPPDNPTPGTGLKAPTDKTEPGVQAVAPEEEKPAAPRFAAAVHALTVRGPASDADRARLDAELARFERRVETHWRGLLSAQQARVVALLPPGERAAGDEPFSDTDLARALALTDDERRQLDALFEFIIETQGEAALAALALKLEFRVHRALIAEFIRRHNDRALAFTTETTRREVREQIALVQQSGGGLADTTAAILRAFDNRRDNALTIARTETAPAFNWASVEAWKQSGVVETKKWVTIMDGHARKAHEEADGQEVGLDESFSVGGEFLRYPGDELGQPENVINCRCGMLAGVKADGRATPLTDWLAPAFRNGHAPMTNRLREFLANGNRS